MRYKAKTAQDAESARAWLRENLQPADVVTERGGKWYSSAIRWFTRHSGEPETWGSHSGIIGVTSNYIQALARVVDCPVSEWQLPGEFEVHRNIRLSRGARLHVAAQAEDYLGRKYGVLKIACHALDGFFGKIAGRDVYFTRRLCRMRQYPICSWVVSFAYARADCFFLGKAPAQASPDDIHDHVVRSSDWVRVAKRLPGGGFVLAEILEVGKNAEVISCTKID